MKRRIHETHASLEGAEFALKAYRRVAHQNGLSVDARISPDVFTEGAWVLSAYAHS